MQMVVCILDKSLLILGAGIDQIPGIKKAKEMGFYTIVLDGNSEAIGKSYADEFYTVSIKHIEQIDAFLNTKLHKRIDGVIAFGVDIPSIISHVTDKLKVNYTIPQNSAILSENKFDSKKFMKQNNINIPPYQLVNSLKDIEDFIEKYSLPIVIKPVDNSASRGINLINSINQIEKAYHYALENSIKKQIIIEKYLEGAQISTESFVINNKIYNIGFADRNYEGMDKYFPYIIENGGDLPSIHMKEKYKKQLESFLEVIANKLNIKNGVIKGDIVIYKDNLYIIEFALRLSGGNFSTIEIPESTGVDFIKIAIKLHSNMEVSKEELKITKNEHISLRYKFLEDLEVGTLKDINFKTINNNIITQSIFLKQGDIINSNITTNHAARVACVIAKGETRDNAINNAHIQLKNLEIIFD